MEMIFQLLLLVLGFVFLVKGSDWFVDGAAGIATKFGIPQLIVGLTIVAMGTSAPEAAVSITAAMNGSADITIGNIVGSNILNVLIILGLSAVVFPLTVDKDTIKFDIPVTIFATLLLIFLGKDGNVTRIDGIILLVVFVTYLLILIRKAKKSQAQNTEVVSEENADEKPKSMIMLLVMIRGGLAMVIFGSRFVVISASFIARQFGLSERFIGLTIVALGTSLPELFTSVVAASKKNCDIAIGNIIGSNLFNILFVVGLSSLIIPVPFASAFRIDSLIALVSVVALLLFCLPKKRLSRFAGAIFLISYVAYFVFWLV